MTSKRLVTTLALLGFLAVYSACVSVNLGPKPGQRSTDVILKSPAAPFEEMSKTAADGAWQNKLNGNTISYYSTCKDPSDPTLDAIMRELFTELRDLKTITTTTRTFSGRDAQETEVEGKLDGVMTRIHALVFKKNGCTYTISHIGVPRSFDEDRGRFKDFLGNFQAP